MSCYMTYNKGRNNKQEVKQMKRSWMKKLRREHNMTQEQLAKAVGISRTMITEIENGNANPSVAGAKKIAAVLGFNWVKFFEDDDEQEVV
jgi:putative transcriptional regulator